MKKWIHSDIWKSAFKMFFGKNAYDEYTDCFECHEPLCCCICRCPYCGKRDKCQCALFDAATGG